MESSDRETHAKTPTAAANNLLCLPSSIARPLRNSSKGPNFMTKSNTIHRTQELFRRREAKEKLELENAFYGHGISFLLRLPD
jgi:hypothetical protein